MSETTYAEKVDLKVAYGDYSDMLFRYCCSRTSDSQIARELVQETYVRAMQYVKKGNEITNLKPFLFKIAKNLLIDWYKSRKIKLSIDTIDASAWESLFVSERVLEESSEVRRALHALDSFHPTYRNALFLRYVAGLKIREIAELLGEKESVISMRIHRGLKKLRLLLL